HVPPARVELEHGVEGRDRLHLRRRETEELSDLPHALARHPARLGLHEVQERHEGRARRRVLRHDAASERPGIVAQHRTRHIADVRGGEVSCLGHRSASPITGPGSSLSAHCSTMRSDWRISSTRTWYLAKQSLSVRVGTSKAYVS